LHQSPKFDKDVKFITLFVIVDCRHISTSSCRGLAV